MKQLDPFLLTCVVKVTGRYGVRRMHCKRAVGAKGGGGTEGMECLEGMWSASIEPVEGVEPMEDHNADNLLKILPNPK